MADRTRGMKFSVGYPFAHADAFREAVIRHGTAVEEVYFAWPDVPSGRMSIHDRAEAEQAAATLLRDLSSFRALGLRLNCLFNAACHGAQALSTELAAAVTGRLGHLGAQGLMPEVVTTASPFIASVIKGAFPDIDVRASVNMRIGTIAGMRYLADCFDSYCVQREYNRDLPHLETLCAWARSNGKRLTLLANSGCLAHCSNQSFHDNLVAHERELPSDSARTYPVARCWQFLARPENHAAFIGGGTWIRPEDVPLYANLPVTLKLATRMHGRPQSVIGAYAAGRHRGNLLDLLEPGMSRCLWPAIIDNSLFPADWLADLAQAHAAGMAEEYAGRLFATVRRMMDE